jgi:hypothetical protein
MNWQEMRKAGSSHYKVGKIQPIDLYRSLSPEALHHWAIFEMMAHCARNVTPSDTLVADMKKIAHYAEMVIANTMKEKKDA